MATHTSDRASSPSWLLSLPASCVCPACNVSALRHLTSAFRPALPAAVRASQRPMMAAGFHTDKVRCADKPPSSFSDLDDLFGEEDVPSSGGAAASRLTATLTDTRVTTQASAAAHAAAASQEAESTSLDTAGDLLDPSNPPRLEPKHMKLLHKAVSDLERKLERACAQERAANPSVDPPTNPNITHLQKSLDVCRGLIASLFPPEVPGVPFDENATADILDYAEAMPGVLGVMAPDTVDPMKLMQIDHKTTRKNRHLFCLFCKPATASLERNQLVYTNLNLLTQFVNERGMVLQRAESRLCMIHQRKIARVIKQARNIGLMSPSSNWRVDHEFVYGAAAKEFNVQQAGAAGSQFADVDAKEDSFGDNIFDNAQDNFHVGRR